MDPIITKNNSDTVAPKANGFTVSSPSKKTVPGTIFPLLVFFLSALILLFIASDVFSPMIRKNNDALFSQEIKNTFGEGISKMKNATSNDSVRLYTLTSDGETVGFAACIETFKSTNKISLFVSADALGRIVKVSVLSFSEQDPSFLSASFGDEFFDQFVGSANSVNLWANIEPTFDHANSQIVVDAVNLFFGEIKHLVGGH